MGEIKRLKSEVAQFREALESYQNENPDVVLVSDPARLGAKFPNHCCKTASFLLLHFLQEYREYNEVRYVDGYAGRDSHGWLKVNDYYVDITPDQDLFADESRPVIVEESGSSAFHQRFSALQVSDVTLTTAQIKVAEEVIAHYELDR
jgi:hypothetical protein